MLDTYKPSVLNALLKKHKIHLSKSLGQNFITDGNIVGQIGDLSDAGPEDTVLEIGAGAGALTAVLARRAGRVITVEIDRRLMPLLEEALEGFENVTVVNEDILKYDLGQLPGGRLIVVGNLPYYITSPVIAKLLASPQNPSRMVFMMQREVAERIAAPPGNKTCGSISILCQYHCEIQFCMEIRQEVFLPRPRVESAVICMTPAEKYRDRFVDEGLFRAVVRAGFGQRRKTLRNALSVLLAGRGIEGTQVETVFRQAEIDPGLRAERLDVSAFLRLTDAIANTELPQREGGKQ